MKRFPLAAGLSTLCVIASGTALLFGQGGDDDRRLFFDRSDTGEILHVLPHRGARATHTTQPLIAPNVTGVSVYPSSYGSGNLGNHGGPQVANAGFFAVYWNDNVAFANGTGVTSLGFANLQSELTAFIAGFADGQNYSESDINSSYTVIQQYGLQQPISSASLATIDAGTGLGYFVDSRATQTSIQDSSIRSYLASLFTSKKVPVSTSVIYGVYFPPGMRIQLQGGSSCTSFCGYHGHFAYNGLDIKYASFPYTNCAACQVSGFTVADMLTIVTGHEIREAVTDPDLNSWFDAAGYEADDKCAWHNLYQTATTGFWVQPEFSNGGTVTASGFTQTYPRLASGGGGCVVVR